MPSEPGACLSLWPTQECEWNTWDIWRSSDVVERTIYLGLALMLGYTFFVLIRFLLRYHATRHEVPNFRQESGHRDLRNRRRLTANLNQGLGTLSAVARVAPFLGLAGTAYGILCNLFFGGVAMEHSRFITWISARTATALATAAAGILVAIPATISHNFIRTRVEALHRERVLLTSICDEVAVRTRSIRLAQTLPLRKAFSNLPPFSLLATSALGCVAALFLAFEPYVPASGLPVGLVSNQCELEGDRPIVLRITNAGQLFINQVPADWTTLANRFSAIFGMREDRLLYILAEDGVPFQTVADAVDIAQNASVSASSSLNLKVSLITPEAMAACLQGPKKTVGAGRP